MCAVTKVKPKVKMPFIKPLFYFRPHIFSPPAQIEKRPQTSKRKSLCQSWVQLGESETMHTVPVETLILILLGSVHKCQYQFMSRSVRSHVQTHCQQLVSLAQRLEIGGNGCPGFAQRQLNLRASTFKADIFTPYTLFNPHKKGPNV